MLHVFAFGCSLINFIVDKNISVLELVDMKVLHVEKAWEDFFWFRV